jgi:hypothetical protein
MGLEQKVAPERQFHLTINKHWLRDSSKVGFLNAHLLRGRE